MSVKNVLIWMLNATLSAAVIAFGFVFFGTVVGSMLLDLGLRTDYAELFAFLMVCIPGVPVIAEVLVGDGFFFKWVNAGDMVPERRLKKKLNMWCPNEWEVVQVPARFAHFEYVFIRFAIE